MSSSNFAAERTLVGILVNDSSQLTAILEAGVTPVSFIDEVSRRIFLASLNADADGRSLSLADYLTLLPHLANELVTISTEAPVAQNVGYYASEVVSASWQREATKALGEIQHAVLTRAAFEPIDRLKAQAFSVIEKLAHGSKDAKGPRSIDAILDDVLPAIEEQIAQFKAGRSTGIPTGISVIDTITGGGLKPGHYTIVAARPGIGKTALAVFIAHQAAMAGHRSLFFTVEMTRDEIVKRFLALESKVPGGRIDLGSLSETELDRIWKARKDLHGALIDVDDSTGGSFEAFEATCRRVKRQHGLSLVVLDYLQLFTLGKATSNRVGMLTEVSNRLKRLALELKIAVIVVSQINREADRDGGAPSLHQLKDTGALEQDADLALLLYRELDTIFISVAKNRRGKWGFVFPVKADLATNTFESETTP